MAKRRKALGSGTMFVDRADAGRRLAEVLAARRNLVNPALYALPRGGVPVAVQISRRLNIPLDLVLVRKIGAPGAPEVALGAVTDGARALTVINPEVARMSGASAAYLEQARRRELDEIKRRRALYLGDRPRSDPRNRTAIVVDDGLATGATARAAAKALRAQGAARVIVAVPVAPADTAAALGEDFDEVICLEQPDVFFGVGAWYQDFPQLSDDEVVALLRDLPTKAPFGP